ncbi:hypothetical protein Barb7_02503 [Bacteroidales bacterium Barb7]|nr:hypothetical protein Barb7_02503 [Bacteroidales bacterium Barb7]
MPPGRHSANLTFSHITRRASLYVGLKSLALSGHLRNMNVLFPPTLIWFGE